MSFLTDRFVEIYHVLWYSSQTEAVSVLLLSVTTLDLSTLLHSITVNYGYIQPQWIMVTFNHSELWLHSITVNYVYIINSSLRVNHISSQCCMLCILGLMSFVTNTLNKSWNLVLIHSLWNINFVFIGIYVLKQFKDDVSKQYSWC